MAESKEISKELGSTVSKNKWESLGMVRRAGALVPLFSVYSAKSLGIGDLSDLKLLIDWCGKTGNSILQLLPMNEVGSTFCPYDAISSFAIEPSYISIAAIPGFSGNKSVAAKIKDIEKRFPAGSAYVDYGIKRAKEDMLWDMYKNGAGPNSKELKKFEEKNGYWLDDFALFKVIKDYHKGLPWYEWENKYKTRDRVKLGAFRKEHEKELSFQRWVQWVAFCQFADAKAYAEAKGVKICGDLPILISRDSADVWAHPEFFKLEFAAGAPPDMYCAKGQRWGMPTYNWDNIASNDYRYHKEKLKFAENFYDILRIDHVVGMFRIWSIPYGDPLENEGLNGFFDPKEEKDWEAHGRTILSVMLENTNMLLTAEDLGMIPRTCPQNLKEFGIPGNDVQRWTKDWQTKHDFLEGEEYRLLSVAMLSTHDTTNWAAWWENEAGTVDQALFIRKCLERKIDYAAAQDKLFDGARSKHGRLRWLDSVESAESLISILGKRREEVMDFIELYDNTYREKEKLWKHLGMKGAMKEKAGPETVKAAFSITLNSRSIFCIELLVDYLMIGGIFKGDPYRYRVNRPGTISKENWSLVVPLPLEKLVGHNICGEIRDMVVSSGREA